MLGLLAVGAAGLARGAGTVEQPVLPLPWVGLVSAGLALATLGPLAQLASAPLDELWHRLYGIDVTIWSPPHLLLLAGAALAPLGLALALRPEVQTGAPAARALALGLLTLVLMVAVGALGELGGHVWTRDPLGYPALAGLLLTPVLMIAALVARPLFAATTVVLLCMALDRGLNAVFYEGLPHHHPVGPPLMLVLPALAIDLLTACAPRLGWRRAAALGAAFGPLFLVLDAPVTHLATAAQWPEVAPYLDGPLSAGVPRPQFPVAVPWEPAAGPVAVLVGSVAGFLGGLVGRAMAALGAPARGP